MSPEELAELMEEVAREHGKKWAERSEAELRAWLSLETWTVREGLLLIVGIDPEAAAVDWGGWVSALGGTVKKVRVLNARPLSRHPIFFAVPPPQLPAFATPESPDFLTLKPSGATSPEEDELRWEKAAMLHELEERLNHVIRIWLSDEHDRARYSVVYFIEWAEKNNLAIPWLQQAREWLPFCLPSESAVAPQPAPEVTIPNHKNPAKWEYTARKIGEAWMLEQRRQREKKDWPSLIEIAKYVEGELTNQHITGPRGKYLYWETVKRHALVGLTERKPQGKG